MNKIASNQRWLEASLLCDEGGNMSKRDITIPYCGLCYDQLEPGFCNEVEGDDGPDMPSVWYCHHEDWDIPGGTCWQKRVCEDFPEMEPWLYYGFECAGCEGDEETGDCICINEDFPDT